MRKLIPLVIFVALAILSVYFGWLPLAITILLACIPLVFGWIPRNGLYGIRVREAFASDGSWYAINQLGGISLIGACLIWILAAAYAPARLVKVIGVGAIVLTLLLLVMTQGWTL